MNAEDVRNELLIQSRVLLKKKCKSLKISGEGSKTDIIDRIIHKIYNNNNNQLNENVVDDEQESISNTIELRRKLRLQQRMQYKPSVPVQRIIIKKKQKQKQKQKRKIAINDISKKPKKNYLTFHFVGIGASKSNSKCKYILFDNFNIKSMIIKSKLILTSTIFELKKFIKTIYSIPSNYDILMLYSHIIISNNNDAKLKHFGITNNSLLTLAISTDKIRNHYDPYTHHHLFRSIKRIKESTNFEIQKGFDIITQQNNINVYKMPICGHLMSKQSLYHYAMSAFMDQNNLYLTCPHTKNIDQQEQKYNDNDNYYINDYNENRNKNINGTKWGCPQCTYINRGNTRYSRIKNQCVMCGHQKPENINLNNTNQCKTIWHYALIKQILSHKITNHDNNNHDFNNLDIAKLELLSARNKLENQNDKKLNLQKCYHCNTIYFKNSKPQKTVNGMKGYKKLKTQCILCQKLFCWNCGKKYVNNHMCDGSFRLQIINILKTCSTKSIGYISKVPSIRACPNINCGQLIHHTEACKHMRCTFCKTNFCFVCIKPMINGRWQCGSYTDRCKVAPRQTLKAMHKTAAIQLKKCFSFL